ncbi:MAG: macro domain-containing protein [Candidatus Pristimantibacillus sp.]
MSFIIVRQDITKIKVDAIVNAANTMLQMGGGVCGAIFKAAGASELQVSCDKLAPIQTGEAFITPGFRLSAKYIIHAAGPVYSDGKHGEEGLLRSCYTNSLKRAVENSYESIAFPLISSGIYGYPKAEALRVATSAIQDFLADHDIEVLLVMFDKAAFNVSKKLLGEVKAFIDENYVDTRRHNQFLQVELDAIITAANAPKSIIFEEMKTGGLEDLVCDLDEPFAQTLFRLIDGKGKTDVEVYKRANLDRKLFSKIRSNKASVPP